MYDNMIIPTECWENNEQHFGIGCICDKLKKSVGKIKDMDLIFEKDV